MGFSGIISFWGRVFSRAWIEARQRVFDTQITSLVRNGLLLCASLFGLWIFSPFSDFFERSGVTVVGLFAGAIVTTLSICSVFAIYFLAEAIVITPARLETEAAVELQNTRIGLTSLKEVIRPNLSISLENGESLTDINFGSTSETYGGDRYTVYTDTEQAACVLCTNLGQQIAKNCQARLLRVWRLDEDQQAEVRIIESLSLGWSRKVNDELLSVDILPGETRRLYIGAVRSNGAIALWRKIQLQPIEYHRMFQNAGHYRLEICVSTEGREPTLFHLDIETCVVPPEPNKLPRGVAKMKLHEPMIVTSAQSAI